MNEFRPLTEFVPDYYPEATVSPDVAEQLWREYGKVVRVDYPSPQTESRWKLTSLGWCGYLPLSEGTGIELRPKVPVGYVWKMLDYAYFTEIKLFDDEFDCQTIPDLIERLAMELARRTLLRARRGLYRAYVGESGRLPCVRGRIDMNRAMRAPWIPEPHCHFQRNTSDIDDNRILTWTLHCIARSGLGQHGGTQEKPVLPLVRQAYRTMIGATERVPFTGRDCRNRKYNRLNSDYAVLHALCRFFLDYLSPGLSRDSEAGKSMLPFLIPMDRLFQDYVALWLHRHLEGWHVERQETFDLRHENQHFDIDIVLYDAAKKARCVIDTKYKAPKDGLASSADIAQAIAYAVAKGCTEAVLLYPAKLARPLVTKVGDIRVRALTFPLDRTPDEAGAIFLQEAGLAA